jgi:diguanylate cyclase (GGDEF)-like protein
MMSNFSSLALAAGAQAPNDAPVSAPRLLIVDDVADNRVVLARRFQRRNFEITEADCGRSALDLIERHSFDIVLLDIMMPDITGVEVLRKIRQKYSQSKLPVIMVTANSRSDDIVEALEVGANDYVTKPVDFAVALARVNTQMERKRASDTLEVMNLELHRTNLNLEGRVLERTAKLGEANRQLQEEIAHRQKSEARSHYLAYHDALTGLANRVLFREDLERALQETRASRSSLAVLFIDLDGFKGVNDTLGHSVGDCLLKTLGERLHDALTTSARIARLGGDEFAVLQTKGDQPMAGVSLAQKIVNLISAPCRIDNHTITVGASVGVAISERGLENPEYLLKSADLAMYRAKADGRGTYRLFDPEMDATAQARRRLENDLRNALNRKELEVYYQPLITLGTKRVSSFEALVRWRHPELGQIEPADFIPVAEDTGLILQLGEWVLREACAQAMTWPSHINVAVNLSPVEFQRGNVVDAVLAALSSSGLPSERLEIEITESVLLEKTTKSVNTLTRLRDLGVRISMDDFGTGFSSLSYLRSYPFDKIKVDRSFVRDLTKDDRSRTIVSAIAGLGMRFGMRTTAEGVETEEQLEWLRAEGCDEVQGQLFSMPVPATEVLPLLAKLAEDSRDASA